MNPTQRKILIAGILVMALMALFPPWIQTAGTFEEVGNNLGYHFLLMGPAKREVIQSNRFYPDRPLNRVAPSIRYTPIKAKIDFERLVLQWVLVGFLSGGLILWRGRQ